ncbi:MAG: TauD/TfdA family dioxygenase, partial [Alphaproteobacteria bacterium]|nr:TauD/TfdA family dioxygenase [Alphaproteobacteria bacterium]
YLSRRAPRKLLTRSKEEEAQTEGVWQPIVRKHPDTGRKALYLNPMRIDQVEGLDREEGDRLMDELFAHCDQPQFQYSHDWRLGDMLVWDNRAAQHQATFDFDPSERRYLHRIMLKGDKPLLA